MRYGLSGRLRWRTINVLRDEEGMALATVVAFSAIMFLLVTTIVMLSVQQQMSTSHIVGRNKALHLADEGLTAYLYQYRFGGSQYVIDNPVMGPVTTTEGSYKVTASQTTSSAPLTLTCTGRVPSLNATRTIVATVRSKPISDFAIFMWKSYTLSSGTIYGDVYAHDDITNKGTINGHAFAGGTCYASNGGTYVGGFTNNYTKYDSSSVLTDLGALKTTATYNGNYYAAPASPGVGYRVILNGNGGTYQTITSVTSTGNLVYSGAPVAFTLPDPSMNAVLFFDCPIWISGTYSQSLTVATSANAVDSSSSGAGGAVTSPYTNSAIFIVDELMPSVTNSAYTLGLVANGDLSIPTWYTSMQQKFGMSTNNVLDIYAAMLSVNGTLHADCTSGPTSTLYGFNFQGSRCMVQAGSFPNTGAGGWTFRYDTRFDSDPPPMFPSLHDGTLKVDSWIEN